MGHTHRWGQTLVTFAPPKSLPPGSDVKGEGLALALLYGLSTLTQECTECHEVRAWTVPGYAAIESRALEELA